MMEDFNAAMAQLESGLAQNAQSAAAAATTDTLRGSLFRAAYNRLALLMETEQRPWQLGTLCQNFDEEAGILPDGMVQRPDCVWTTNGSEVLSMDGIRTSLRKISDISTEKDCSKLVLTFTANANGWLTRADMHGRAVNSVVQSRGDCTVRLTDFTADAVLEQRSSFNLPFDISQVPRRVPMDFLLQAGHRYRLEVIMDDLSAKPEFDFNVDAPAGLVLVGCQTPSVSVHCPLTLEESTLGGLVLVRYRFQGTAGTPKLSWNGTTLPLRKIRTVTAAGETFQEAEFRRSSSLSAGNSSLDLSLTCPSGSCLSLYAVSAAVI